MLGGGPRLFIKRDDAIPFGFGGNKVRKLALVAARAVADGADTLITAGGVQSNHARATAAAAAKLGLRAVLVANGEAPRAADRQRAARRPARRRSRLRAVARRSRADDAAGRRAPARRRPQAVRDPDRRVDAARRARLRRSRWPSSSIRCRRPTSSSTATSSGGTQAGLVAGCRLLGLRDAGRRHQRRRFVGVAAVAGPRDRQRHRRSAATSIQASCRAGTAIEVDDRFVGERLRRRRPTHRERRSQLARADRGDLPRSRPTPPRRWPA